MSEQTPPTPAPSDPVQPAPAPSPAPSASGPSFPDLLARAWDARNPFEKKALSVGAAGFVLVAFSTLMPWINIFTGSVTGTSTGTGKFVLIICLIALAYLVYCVAKNQLTPLVHMIMAGVGAGLTLWMLVVTIRMAHSLSAVPSMPSMSGDENAFAKAFATQMHASTGFGLYLAIIASLLIVGGFSVLYSPVLTKFQFTPQHKPLWIALGVGAAVGLLVGFI